MKKKVLLGLLFLLVLVAVLNRRWLGYLVHLAHHQVRVILGTELIANRANDARIPAQERAMLKATMRIRSFAEKLYGLQSSKSYQAYFDLGRKYLGYNITVTPEFSLKPVAFTFWPIGSFDYLGFFSHERALDWTAGYRDQGMDVHLAEIGGYSTLGWFEDPLYSSQLSWGELPLARLLGHEIAHERLYFRNDTTSSELLASYIERRFALDYARNHSIPVPGDREIAALRARHARYFSTIAKTREELENLYKGELPAASKRQQKQKLFSDLHQKLSSPEFKAFATARELPPVEKMNNAWLVQSGRYAPLNRALDQVYESCKVLSPDTKYQCWFKKLEMLNDCSSEKRKEWLKGDGSIPAGYCRS